MKIYKQLKIEVMKFLANCVLTGSTDMDAFDDVGTWGDWSTKGGENK